MSDDGVFDERVAATYDEVSAGMFADDVLGPTVDVLAGLAAGGRALEFAVGTGRVALALSARGIDVAGIERSQAMYSRMAAKPGADQVPVTIGDMSTVRVPGGFRLVYLVYNTITNLLTQDAQVECFRNAAAHLEPGGHFVVEVFVPAVRRLPPGERFVPFDVTPDHVGVDEYDVADQLLVSHHTWFRDGRAERFDTPHRYVWPSELDLMARLAGLSPTVRWADWHRAPFTSDSPSHVSVWTKPA